MGEIKWYDATILTVPNRNQNTYMILPTKNNDVCKVEEALKEDLRHKGAAFEDQPDGWNKVDGLTIKFKHGATVIFGDRTEAIITYSNGNTFVGYVGAKGERLEGTYTWANGEQCTYKDGHPFFGTLHFVCDGVQGTYKFHGRFSKSGKPFAGTYFYPNGDKCTYKNGQPWTGILHCGHQHGNNRRRFQKGKNLGVVMELGRRRLEELPGSATINRIIRE